MDEVAILDDAVDPGDEGLPIPGDEGHAGAGVQLHSTDELPDPGWPNVHLGQCHGPAGIPVLVLGTHRDHPAHDLAGGPGDGGDGGDAESLIDLGTAGIVDPGHDALNPVGLPCDSGGQDVAVITAAHRREGMCALNSGALKGLAVESDPGHRDPAEISGKPPEGLRVLIDDSD